MHAQEIFKADMTSITGAPKLINSDLFLEKRATVPIKHMFLYVICDLFLEKRATVPIKHMFL